jgi:Concanavalin A-like lectin/glucanases superfamily
MKRIIPIFAVILVGATLLWAGRSFNGSTDIITIPAEGNVLDIASGPETISMWVYPTTVPSTGEHDWLGHGTAETGGVEFEVGWGSYGGSASSPNEFGYVFGCCGPFGPSYGGCGTGYTANGWYQIVIWVDTAGVIHGTPSSGMSVSGPVICNTYTAFTETRVANTGNIYVGKGWFGTNYQGYVAEVAIWNRILLPGQIAALAHVCPEGPSARRMGFPQPVGYFPLTGASGSSIEPDLSGNKNLGVLTGTAAVNHAPCTP